MSAAEVYHLDDLLSRARLDAGAQRPARLAVLGRPIAHSLSPRLHAPALAREGVDARYIRLEVAEGELAEAFARMSRLGFIGCNVTVPHKFEALAACDEVHPDAAALGAVNTVRFEAGGTRGFNTDGPGFEAAVAMDFGLRLEGRAVLVTGAGGGAGQAIAAHCVLAGVRRLVLVNRSLDKLEPLSRRLRGLRPELDLQCLAPQQDGLCEAARDCDLLVNMSSLGLAAGDPSPLPAGVWQAGHCGYDAVYREGGTAFLAEAKAAGCQTSDGLSMLVHQGALAFRIWYPGSDPLPAMLALLEQPRSQGGLR